MAENIPKMQKPRFVESRLAEFVMYFIDRLLSSHTHPLRRYPKKVAVSKSVAKSVGVHAGWIVV